MELHEMEQRFDETKAKYNSIATSFACTCCNTSSLTRALSSFRNYTTFINVVGASYFDSIPDDICAMTEHIEELAQKEE
jgi:hypothetical protein